jgi:carbon-monoxide dehydrogenase large subunit
MDYALPRSSIIADFRTTMDESTPCLNNAMGVKGVGKLGTIGATPAVVNAVLDALARAGWRGRVDRCRCRLTSERVWRALNPA